VQTAANASSSAAAAAASSAAAYAADPRALAVESLMSDYARQADTATAASVKLVQLLDLMLPPPPPLTHARSNSIVSAGFGAAAPAQPQGAGMSDEALKRNPHLHTFLACAAGRLADRIAAHVGSLGSGGGGGGGGGMRASMGGAGQAHTPLGAAMADKAAARWLGLLHLLNPFRPPTDAEPYGARVLELLRLLAARDEKRIGALNSGRLTTGLLHALHALSEMSPSTLEHMRLLENKQANEESVDAHAAMKRQRKQSLRSITARMRVQSEFAAPHVRVCAVAHSAPCLSVLHRAACLSVCSVRP
jgi:hypothetical protein